MKVRGGFNLGIVIYIQDSKLDISSAHKWLEPDPVGTTCGNFVIQEGSHYRVKEVLVLVTLPLP